MDAAPEQAGQLLAQVQTQPGAFLASPGGHIKPAESLEQPGLMFGAVCRCRLSITENSVSRFFLLAALVHRNAHPARIG